MKKLISVFAIIVVAVSCLNISCSKGGGDTPPASNPCSGITINLTATPTNAAACLSNGSIVASATGSTGFTYSINGTTFQASGTFNNVASGNFTVTAKDGNGCTKTATITVGTNAGTAGPLFTAVKTLMQANCQSCHNNTIANGGMNWTVDCNIVANKDRIKVRAVDLGTMPPTGALAQGDKDKITAWINAGGRFTD
jgi:uncharacterized membrane protein